MYYFGYFMFCCVCLFSMSGHCPWITCLWFLLESWFPWLLLSYIQLVLTSWNLTIPNPSSSWKFCQFHTLFVQKNINFSWKPSFSKSPIQCPVNITIRNTLTIFDLSKIILLITFHFLQNGFSSTFVLKIWKTDVSDTQKQIITNNQFCNIIKIMAST